jgi:hypothetical protein
MSSENRPGRYLLDERSTLVIESAKAPTGLSLLNLLDGAGRPPTFLRS